MIGSMDASNGDGESAACRELEDVDVGFVDRLLREISTRGEPLFVGLDGRSGVGKSTLAEAIAARVAMTEPDHSVITVIDGDQFYAGGSAESWDLQTPSEKASRVIDWRRQRRVLQQLREHGAAEWYPFDWDAPDWDAEIVPLARDPICARAGSIVLLEGAYSCRPELHDLLDLRVLLDVPTDVRRRRLLEREGDAYRADWEARWSAAEDHYFGTVMTPDRFDILLGPS
jgi:uridine kinase